MNAESKSFVQREHRSGYERVVVIRPLLPLAHQLISFAVSLRNTLRSLTSLPKGASDAQTNNRHRAGRPGRQPYALLRNRTSAWFGTGRPGEGEADPRVKC